LAVTHTFAGSPGSLIVGGKQLVRRNWPMHGPISGVFGDPGARIGLQGHSPVRASSSIVNAVSDSGGRRTLPALYALGVAGGDLALQAGAKASHCAHPMNLTSAMHH
jgi:hypothetical protein